MNCIFLQSEGMALFWFVDWSAKDSAKGITAIVSVWRRTKDKKLNIIIPYSILPISFCLVVPLLYQIH